MNVTWNLNLKPEDIANISALKEGDRLHIKHKDADVVVELSKGVYEFEVYDELDMSDYL